MRQRRASEATVWAGNSPRKSAARWTHRVRGGRLRSLGIHGSPIPSTSILRCSPSNSNANVDVDVPRIHCTGVPSRTSGGSSVSRSVVSHRVIT